MTVTDSLYIQAKADCNAAVADNIPRNIEVEIRWAEGETRVIE